MGLWRRTGPGKPAVHYVRTESVKGGAYHIHRGPNRAEALAFLRQKPVTEPLVYVVVETPEGNVGRDFIYIFDEPAGTTIEFGPRPLLATPAPLTTHCAWCGFYIQPIDVSSLPDSIESVQVYLTVQEVLASGFGFRCKSCNLLQCGLCTDMAADAAESGRRAAPCRRCGTDMHSHLELPPVMTWTYCLQVQGKDKHWGSLIDPTPDSQLPMYCGVVHAAKSRLADVAQEQVFDKIQRFELPRRVVFFQGEPTVQLKYSEAYGVIEEGDTEVRPYGADVVPGRQVEPPAAAHPAFRLKAGMDKETVIGLLGEPYRSSTARETYKDPAPAILEDEYWLYFEQVHDVEMIFQLTLRSGALLSAELKSKDADWNETLLARIDQEGIAAAESYRTALGANQL